jgi:hypothetical protein
LKDVFFHPLGLGKEKTKKTLILFTSTLKQQNQSILFLRIFFLDIIYFEGCFFPPFRAGERKKQRKKSQQIYYSTFLLFNKNFAVPISNLEASLTFIGPSCHVVVPSKRTVVPLELYSNGILNSDSFAFQR